MVPELSPIAHLFALDDRMLDRLVGDFAAGDWRVRDGAGHTPRWITGHVATHRLRLVGLMGMPPLAASWTAAFGRGTSDADVPEEFDMKTAIQGFHDAHERIAQRWEQLTPADLAQPFGRTLPDGSDTLGGAIRFLAWHEAYHFGQLGLLRRLAGKPGLA